MASLNDTKIFVICDRCGGSYVIKDLDKLRLETIQLTKEQLAMENLQLRAHILTLEKQISEKPTKRMKINPGQDG